LSPPPPSSFVSINTG